MATNKTVTVTTSATKLADGVTGKNQSRGALVKLGNTTAAVLYVGFSTGVTTSNGYPVPASTGTFEARLRNAEALYGIVASGSNDVRVVITEV